MYTGLFDGGWPNAPHRVIENSTVVHWKSAGSPPAGKRPSEGVVVAHCKNGDPIHLYDDTIPLANMTGDVERLALYAGQSVGLVHEIKSASAIVHEIAEEARARASKFGATMLSPTLTTKMSQGKKVRVSW